MSRNGLPPGWRVDVQGDNRVYREVPVYSDQELRDLLNKGDPTVLADAAISVSLNHEDRAFAESVLILLANHPDPIVRGDAILGFGHLARRFGHLGQVPKSLIEAALGDQAVFVRQQAISAADDVRQFLD